MANKLGFGDLFHQGWKGRIFAEVDSSQRRAAARYYSPSKTRGFVCENGLRNVRPHASLVFSLLRADRALEMGHPRFTGRVTSFTSSGPPGPISCLDLACKENSRPSQPDSEVEPSKHTGRTETGGNEECKGRREGWSEATFGEDHRSSGSLDSSHITIQ
ncbi:hypothetical protein VZT92_020562 [Zoarces viviparus]|uniref:Uncharacterized protein n=1 Tax=Zoarces viviparus TaxID=48416 RepID=A0AAW1EDN2_ZOAVI